MSEDVQMRHIFSTNEDVLYKRGTSTSFGKGWHHSRIFLLMLVKTVSTQKPID